MLDLKILYIIVYTLIVICLWIIIALLLDRKQTKQDNKDMKTYKLCDCGFYWDAKEDGSPICRKPFNAICMPIFEGTLKQIKEFKK